MVHMPAASKEYIALVIMVGMTDVFQELIVIAGCVRVICTGLLQKKKIKKN